MLDGGARLALQVGIEHVHLAAHHRQHRIDQRGLAGLVLRHHAFAGDDEAIGLPHVGDRRRPRNEIDRVGGADDLARAALG